MAIRGFKPTTPSRRHMTMATFEEITTDKPEKSLLVTKKKQAGRNAQGKITVRHRGGGHKQKYRIIDFKRDKDGIPGKISTIEYDPNRSAYISLVTYADGEKRYIITPVGVKVGDKIEAGEKADIKPGNCLPLKNIPIGTVIHNIELQKGKGAQMVRSAGASAQLMAKEGNYATLRLPSGEMRFVRIECKATIGVVSNTTHEIVNYGNAGRVRRLGFRPTVRGSVMNPNDHPHGGGEGKTPNRSIRSIDTMGQTGFGLQDQKA